MRKLVLTGSLIASMFAGQTLMAQEAAKPGQLTVSGQVRPRFEFRNGFKKPLQEGEEPAGFMEQRARINMLYKAPLFNVKLSVQDVRIWGDVGQINKSDGLTSFHEAYGEYTPNSSLAVKIGRQELVYDDSRVLGNLGWAAQGRSHDAIKLVYTDSTWEGHLIATYNQDATKQEPAKLQSATAGDYNGVGSSAVGFKLSYPVSTQIAYFKTKFKSGDISFVAINDLIQKTATETTTGQEWVIDQATGTLVQQGTSTSTTSRVSGQVDRFTIGMNPNFKFGKVKLNGSFYYQTGKQSASTKVNGMLASLSATYVGKKVIPTIGFDYLSGDDTSTVDVNEGFNPLYGTHHKFYGFMDYFYVGNGHGNRGLIDLYAKAVFKLGKPGKLLAHLHGFMSAAENYDKLAFLEDGSKNSSKFLGTELDLVYVKPITKGVLFKLGTSFMFATDGMYSIKGTAVDASGEDFNSIGVNNWSWAMIDFKF